MEGRDANDMTSTPKGGFMKADVADMPKEAPNEQEHVSLSDESAGEPENCDIDVEKTDFLVEANKSNIFKSKGKLSWCLFFVIICDFCS